MWKKILGNLGGVALSCLAVQKSGVMGNDVNWGSVGIGVLMCVIANQVGLFQHKPQAGQ